MDNLKIDSFIKSKNRNFILNNYEICNNFTDDFNIIVYFLEYFKIRIIIRKINNDNNGWNEELLFKLYDNEDNSNYEMIKLGTCNKNWKLINVKTNIVIVKKENIDIRIPKKIYQTYSNNNYHNISHYNSVQSLIDYNPEYDYHFFNDIDCREFIKNTYDEIILESYDRLYPCAYKADLFRYLLIYKYGGIYIDNKYLVRISFNNIIESDFINIYCKDIHQKLLFNSLLISIPNDVNYKLVIDKIIDNVENNFYGECPLHPTGPRLFYEQFNDENIILKHVVENPKDNYLNCKICDNYNNIILNTCYNGYYNNKNHRNKIKNDYDFCFRNKIIYLKKFILLKDYKFSILIDRNVQFDVKIIEEDKELIKIKLFLKPLNFKMKKIYKFIFINNKNHELKEYDLIEVFNKVFVINL